VVADIGVERRVVNDDRPPLRLTFGAGRHHIHVWHNDRAGCPEIGALITTVRRRSYERFWLTAKASRSFEQRPTVLYRFKVSVVKPGDKRRRPRQREMP
jgi:hypothetical protein